MVASFSASNQVGEMMKKKTTGNKLKKEQRNRTLKKRILKKKITIKRNSLFF
jgi:hypothetical protein